MLALLMLDLISCSLLPVISDDDSETMMDLTLLRIYFRFKSRDSHNDMHILHCKYMCIYISCPLTGTCSVRLNCPICIRD